MPVFSLLELAVENIVQPFGPAASPPSPSSTNFLHSRHPHLFYFVTTKRTRRASPFIHPSPTHILSFPFLSSTMFGPFPMATALEHGDVSHRAKPPESPKHKITTKVDGQKTSHGAKPSAANSSSSGPGSPATPPTETASSGAAPEPPSPQITPGNAFSLLAYQRAVAARSNLPRGSLGKSASSLFRSPPLLPASPSPSSSPPPPPPSISGLREQPR